mmetsp:Transcript_3880/g.8155  ORF Transcript_3880/g.8155 Transcript_3880/m.8155 type:complete len:214 (+) Transcript_3880:549-1190(+)
MSSARSRRCEHLLTQSSVCTAGHASRGRSASTAASSRTSNGERRASSSTCVAAATASTTRPPCRRNTCSTHAFRAGVSAPPRTTHSATPLKKAPAQCCPPLGDLDGWVRARNGWCCGFGGALSARACPLASSVPSPLAAPAGRFGAHVLDGSCRAVSVLSSSRDRFGCAALSGVSRRKTKQYSFGRSCSSSPGCISEFSPRDTREVLPSGWRI